jgi:ATP-binding cassette subfamily E protein 1
MNRIAIVDESKCKPTKCNKECISWCPPQMNGNEVIRIVNSTKTPDIEDFIGIKSIAITNKKTIAEIIESQCIGCNMCVKKCPFDAIKIVNLPGENAKDIVHKYGPNSFRLYKLPQIKTHQVIGIIGENGVGKTTLIKILSGEIIPNFDSKVQLNWKLIASKFRGSTLHDYLKLLGTGKLTISVKPQHFSPEQNITVQTYLLKYPQTHQTSHIFKSLDLYSLMDKTLGNLSGGEMQRLLCGVTLCAESDVYIFDEPSNYLDIKQRLIVTDLIKELSVRAKYVCVIDHDLAMLDYMADEIYIIYGKPGVYGIVSNPMTPLDGINVYLNGYLPSENIRFRSDEFNLKPSPSITPQTKIPGQALITYSESIVNFPKFKLIIPAQSININTSINVILGPNGVGKTTFINYLADKLQMNVSIKEQILRVETLLDKKTNQYPTVKEFLYTTIGSSMCDQSFIFDVIKPLDFANLFDQKVNQLSGGELQQLLIIKCLGTPATLYLIDEPSANLDIEKRIRIIRVIKKFIISNHKCAFIIEHDIMMGLAFAQEVISSIILLDTVEDPESNDRVSTVGPYLDFGTGINQFLKKLNITMRTGGHNRPRINKLNSQLDSLQKIQGTHWV